MVKVTGGTFQMGSTSGDSDEKPVHSVTVSSFWISKHEVTQKEWMDVMGAAPELPWFSIRGMGDNFPAYNISWYDAVKFCNTLSDNEGLTKAYSLSGSVIRPTVELVPGAEGYRLPTEAEWEYAARGGKDSEGYTYSGSNTVDDVAWYTGNSESKTHSVGGKQANELGLYDMSGNVWEWCWDGYGSYSSSAQTNPTPTGDTSSTGCVLRGGCWNYSDSHARSASRDHAHLSYQRSDIGFRVARSVTP
jgi:formylglycine-generating enzyme required for sulfatase activity